MMGSARAGVLVLAAFVATLSAQEAAGQTLRLIAPRAFPTGGNPAAVVAEDLDADTHLDLAVANYDQGTMTVLLGDGHGDFTPVDDFPASTLPTQMACADFDGDRVLDMLVTETESDFIYFLRGGGDGTFEFPVTSATGHDPIGVVAAKMDGDDVLDAVIAFAPESGGQVGILLGKGDGTFATDTEKLRALPAPTYGVGAGDFNGDQIPDVVAVTLNDQLQFLRGDGLGGLSRPTSFATGKLPFALDVGDVDLDAHLDVLVADGEDNTLSFMRGDGAGMFERASVIPVGLGPATIQIFDINGDGFPDAVSANTVGGDVSIVPGRGAAGFGRPRHYAAPLRPFAATAGDFDEDGLLDIVAASQNDSGSAALVMLQREDGFEAIEAVTPQVRTPRLAAGDIDGDGLPDLAVGDPTAGVVRFLPSLGRAGFGDPIATVEGVAVGATALADLNGDGRLDLVVASPREAKAAVALALPAGGFAAPTTMSTDSTPNAVEVVDLDGDGPLDVAFAGVNPPSATVFFGDGEGGFATSRNVALLGSPFRLTSGDFDGDGRQDLAVGNSMRAEVTLLLSRPGRTFETTVPEIAVSAAFVAAGDLDADGDDDLVATGGVNSSLQILRNDGGGTFTKGQAQSAGGFASSLSLRDLTGDSLPDAIVTLQTTATLEVAVNRGDLSLAPPVQYLVGIRPSATVGVDFDADGRYDLAAEGDGAWVITNASDLRIPRGDGNGDGLRSAADAVTLMRELGEHRRQTAERVTSGSVPSSIGLDANGDGYVDSFDVAILLRRLFAG